MKLKKSKFYRHKTSIILEDVDIEKVLVSNKISLGEKNYKHFIGYLYNGIKYFLIEDDDLLEKYNTIWDKVSADIKKEFEESD